MIQTYALRKHSFLYNHATFVSSNLQRSVYPFSGESIYVLHACTGVIAIGIGRATAKFLTKCGADVIALSRTQADLDSLKEEVQMLLLTVRHSMNNGSVLKK